MYKRDLRRKCSLMFTIALVKYAAGCMKCSSIKYIAQGPKVISEGRKYENEKGEKERIHNEGAEEGHISLAVLCPGCCIDIYIQLHTYVWCPAGIPAIQCQGGYMGKPLGGAVLF